MPDKRGHDRSADLLEGPLHIEKQIAELNNPARGYPEPQRWLRVKAACEYAQIGRSKLYELIRQGDIAARKMGSATLISLNSLDLLMLNLPELRARENAVRRRWMKPRRRQGRR